MALNAYLTNTQALLQNPAAPTTLYATADLTRWINLARGQLAGDAECIRVYASLAVTGASNQYAFSAISLGGAAGVQGVLNVRMATCRVTGGKASMNAWPWEYFNRYFLAQISAAAGTPLEWAQFGQGVGGTIFVSPLPSGAFTLDLDTVCYPIDLVSDATAEAIPFPWTDCVPYFAAYLALLSAQTGQRQADAARMLERYEEFKTRARRYSTPTVLPFQYWQTGGAAPVVPAGVGSDERRAG